MRGRRTSRPIWTHPVSESWYDVVSGTSLAQGDLLLSSPIYRVETRAAVDGPDVQVVEEEHDVIVLTQSCDLVNTKVDEVLVAAVLSYDALCARDGDHNPRLKGKDFRRAAVQGNLPPYSLLQQREGSPALPWSLVDFHNLFSLPKLLAVQIAEGSGDRLRLRPPYREHLAQAFARYMMRVGLPSTLTAFEAYSPLAPPS